MCSKCCRKVTNNIFGYICDEVVEKLKYSNLGVKGEKWCGTLLYVDDTLLLIESPHEWQKMLDILYCTGQAPTLQF